MRAGDQTVLANALAPQLSGRTAAAIEVTLPDIATILATIVDGQRS